MKGFSIAVNDWGVHAILYASFVETDLAAWLSGLGEVRDRTAKHGRAPGLFLDARDISSRAMSSAHLDGLVDQLTRKGLGHGAVLLSDPALAKRLSAAIGKTDARNVRIIVSDGRDRVLIAAAYGWILNGREPSAIPPAASGEILRFPKAVPVTLPPAATGTLRAAG